MKKTVSLKILCLVLAAIFLFSGCDKGKDIESDIPKIAGFIPALFVTGDVDSPLRISRDEIDELTWSKTEKDDTSLPSIELQELVDKANPRASQYDILLVGSDGLASKIDGTNLEGCHIAYSDEFSWEIIADFHPISTRVKMLQKIIVVTKEGVVDSGSVMLSELKNETTLTPGQAMLFPLQFSNQFEGTSSINDREVTVFTPHYRFAMTGGLSGDVAVISNDGEMKYVRDLERYIEIVGNRMDFVFSDGTVMKNIAGVLSDAPRIAITETFSDAKHMLERGDKVLIIELDGWGWDMGLKATEKGVQPFLDSLESQAVMAAYPSISPVGLATMLTGKLPNEHGIQDRKTKEINPGTQDLFAVAKEMGKKASYIEGDASLIRTSIEPVLSPDIGGNPGTDDEVYRNALSALGENPDLLFVHFHGIDDDATTFGPYSDENMKKIREVDDYVKYLVERWDGKVIITADHGLHDVKEPTKLGSHGTLCREDMIVPYIICNGGQYAGS